MTAWTVALNKKPIDIVFYDNDCLKEYVKNSLINHDGYDPRIVISRRK